MKRSVFHVILLIILLIGFGSAAPGELTPEQTQQAEALIAQFRAPKFAVRLAGLRDADSFAEKGFSKNMQ